MLLLIAVFLFLTSCIPG